MLGQLEQIILTELHDKAMEAEMDLNDPEQFLKFAAKLDDVVNQVQHTVKHIVKSTKCGCGKNAGQPPQGGHGVPTGPAGPVGPTPEVVETEVVE